jgi:hypothetical protein
MRRFAMPKLRLPLSRIQQLTFSRGLLIALGTLMVGAALGWADPPPCVIWAVGVAGGLLVLAGLLTVDADHCDAHLRRVKPNAAHLAQNLTNFDSFWSAFERGELLDGTLMSRDEAMAQLLYRFTRFFSAAWVYEDHCRKHRHHDEVVDWLREVYKSLGEPKRGDSDERVMSEQLHAIGEAGTDAWGTEEVRPKPRGRVEDALKTDAFVPLRRLLEKADLGTDALARLERTAKALERLTKRLGEKGY